MWVNKKKKKSILIVGGFHEARSLANLLLEKDYHVTVVNKNYAGCYLFIYIVGTVLLTFCSGCTLVQGAFEFASSLGTVGLSIGVTNPNTSTICLLIEIVGMVLGRLEIFVIFKAFLKR